MFGMLTPQRFEWPPDPLSFCYMHFDPTVMAAEATSLGNLVDVKDVCETMLEGAKLSDSYYNYVEKHAKAIAKISGARAVRLALRRARRPYRVKKGARVVVLRGDLKGRQGQLIGVTGLQGVLRTAPYGDVHTVNLRDCKYLVHNTENKLHEYREERIEAGMWNM